MSGGKRYRSQRSVARSRKVVSREGAVNRKLLFALDRTVPRTVSTLQCCCSMEVSGGTNGVTEIRLGK